MTATIPAKPKSNMIGLEPLYDFVELCLWTGAVKGERPVSAILVAAPGGGKTSVLQAMNCEAAPFVTDLTSREISATLRSHPNATHMLLSDMMNLFSHRKSTTMLACAMLSSLTGDSLRTDSFSGDKVADRQLGLITAIPTNDIAKRQVKQHLSSAGFATRFMILRYTYSPDTVLKIHEYIRSDAYSRPGVTSRLEIPPQKEPIEISPEMAMEIQLLAITIKSEEDVIGTRIHHHLRALVKARARRDGRSAANSEDIEAIKAYAQFFSPRGQML